MLKKGNLYFISSCSSSDSDSESEPELKPMPDPKPKKKKRKSKKQRDKEQQDRKGSSGGVDKKEERKLSVSLIKGDNSRNRALFSFQL